MRVVGILGGTFDPVHCGHLRLALEMRERLGLERVLLVPAPSPRLRGRPGADPTTRRRLLEAAIAGADGLEVDPRELDRPGPTVTVDTLHALRRDHPETALCLLLGMDAFARLDEWVRYEEICDLAHLGVADRPGARPPARGPVADLLAARAVDDPRVLAARPAGCIVVREIPALDISATGIRERLADGRSVRWLVPDPVHTLLHEEEIYARHR